MLLVQRTGLTSWMGRDIYIIANSDLIDFRLQSYKKNLINANFRGKNSTTLRLC